MFFSYILQLVCYFSVIFFMISKSVSKSVSNFVTKRKDSYGYKKLNEQTIKNQEQTKKVDFNSNIGEE